MRINFDESKPIYLQIADAIKKAIVRGEYGMGDKVPSVRELAIELKVNPNTVQHAYQELLREGVIFTKRGQGNFVTEDPEKLRELREGMLNQLVDKFVDDLKGIGIPIEKEKILKLLEEENDRS